MPVCAEMIVVVNDRCRRLQALQGTPAAKYEYRLIRRFYNKIPVLMLLCYSEDSITVVDVAGKRSYLRQSRILTVSLKLPS